MRTLLLALLLAGTAATAQAQDLLIRGGTIYTGNPAQPTAEVVVVRGGRIAYVGDDAVELGPGEAVFVPQNEYHGFENTSDGEVVMAWYYAGAASLDDAGFVTRSEDEGGERPAG